jgi:hypothetical protein
VATTVILLAACAPGAPGRGPAAISECPMFPADNYWHADVAALPLHPQSATWTATVGTTRKVHADFGSGLWDGGPIGIPYTTVGAGQPRVPITFDYDDESDPGPYPIPSDAPIEGGPAADGDRHVLVVDTADCKLYETFDSHPAGNRWTAGSGAVYDLRSNAMRPSGWTSADAAGLPILPGLVRYDEVAAGRIDHAIRFTAPVTQRSYVWPARHQAGSTNSAAAPPMGAWFRLRPDYDTSRFTGAARVIADAMKQHGMILADNGSAWYISGAPDERWNNTNLHQLDVITGSDFQVVDSGQLMVHPDSAQAR